MPENNIYICDCCGKEFVPSSSTVAKLKRGEQKTITCSRECSSKLKKKSVITYCENCGIKLIRRKSHYERQIKLGQHQYCSLQCQKEFQHKETHEIRKCEMCDTTFECSKISTRRFCCNKCQNKWQSTIVGDLNPRSTKIHYNCDYCGKDYLLKQYKIKQDHNFCSFDCQQKWLNKIFMQKEEMKQKSRERAIKMLEEGRMPLIYTKPQKIINELLDENNIQYKNDYGIKYYSIDNYLLETGLMIEVMGDYWHSNPLVFNYEKLNETQTKRTSRDKAKHTYVKNQYDVEILYLWEQDIIENIEKCNMLINSYINNNGQLINYHSFNYHIENNSLILNKNIINLY